MNGGVRTGRGRVVAVVRIALLVVIVVTDVAALAGFHRGVDAEVFASDLRSGRVEEFAVGPAGTMQSGFRLSCTLAAVPQDEKVTTWSTGPWPWQQYRTDDLGARQSVTMARNAGLSPTTPGPDWMSWAALAAFLVIVGTIIFGPHPRRVTKWAAFWLALVPFGVGQVWLLLAEAPWSAKQSERPEPLSPREQRKTQEGDRRTTAILPFLAALVGGSIISLVGLGPY